jgi:hypothetical protein
MNQWIGVIAWFVVLALIMAGALACRGPKTQA